MKIIKQIIKYLIVTTALLSCAVYAATDDEKDVLPYKLTGIINEVRADEGVIIIDDKLFIIPHGAKFNANYNYDVYHWKALKSGMSVGINLRSYRSIEEIWLIDPLSPRYDRQD